MLGVGVVMEEGRKVPVVEISYYRDGRSLGVSPVDEETLSSADCFLFICAPSQVSKILLVPCFSILMLRTCTIMNPRLVHVYVKLM